jgi:aromatic ring-cleaving dioxygenase
MDIKQADVSAPAPTVPAMTGLSAQDRAILDLERLWWRRPGSKQQAIYDMGLRETRYYQRLVWLIDDPAALAYDPVTVNRLRRRRERKAG